MKIWVLLSSWNMYDQQGRYYIASFRTKPTVEQLVIQLRNDGYSKCTNDYVEELANLLLSKGETPDGGGGGTCQYHLEEETTSN